MRATIFLLFALTAVSVVKAQIRESKPQRSAITLTAKGIDGYFYVEQLPPINEVLVRKMKPAGERFPADSAKNITWSTDITEPVIVTLAVHGKEVSSSQKIYLKPGDSLSLTFNGKSQGLLMDTLHSNAGTLNNVLAWYDYHTSEVMNDLWTGLDENKATVTSMEGLLQRMNKVYATAKQLAGKNTYLETMYGFNLLTIRYAYGWYYDDNKITPGLPTALLAPAYDDKAFALMNNPVFVKYILPEEARRGFFFTYDWMLNQRYKSAMTGMNDSTKMAFLGQKILQINKYAPFKEVARFVYVKNTYFSYLNKHYTTNQLPVARKLAMAAAAPIKDTAFQNRLQQLIATMGNVLPGSPGLNFALEDHKGKIWHFSDLKGKVVYIDVWTTWCGPCRAEAPLFEKMAADYAGKDVVFLGISADRPKDKATWIEMAGHKQTLQLYSGEKTAFMQYYQVPGYPTFLLFDKDGKVVSADAPRPSAESIIREAINKLL
ncbi:MAG: TlpA family protein disulfide reductase [Chitinophaga sp.]|uniref:TlpA family protein disulfide reductase n=1 Tax=Chitinophaga sp. TaxID=1869181 RepID=UPI001B2C2124|nr:TlpA disulfide reductase family protein [Chitinophaga sp.]MBO9728990.1 TlpA family protein disulfide reductase [Chitinophaga sp.]